MQAHFVLRCIPYSCEYPSDAENLVCNNCGGPLEAVYEYEKLRSGARGIPVDSKRTGVWRYAPLLPVNETTPLVSLGEGGTPLMEASRLRDPSGVRVFVKDDTRNPTLSFKDRKSTVAISKAAEFRSAGVVNMTAGNAGSSVAAYAARAQLPAYILAVEGISDSKLAKLLSYGAHVFSTDAPTKEVMTFVDEVSKKYGLTNMTAASRYNPYVKEGSKTVVFELYEQTGGSLPDYIIAPVGSGGNIAGIYKGLRELKLLGLLERYPKLVGVQGEGCAPFVETFDRGLPPDQIPVVKNAHTIAHSILDSWTPDGDQALRAIRETGGFAVSVSDREMLSAMKEMSAKEGIFVEPAASATFAALKKSAVAGRISGDESAVLIATGSGANQPAAAIEAWGRPPAIPLDVEAFSKHFSETA